MDHALIMWNIVLEENIHKLKWTCNSSNKDTWISLAFAFTTTKGVLIRQVISLDVE